MRDHGDFVRQTAVEAPESQGASPAHGGRFRLHGLWDRIVHVADGEAKADFIAEPDAILIDDSFRERADAHERRGIATFDATMIELLLDDRA